MAVDGVRIFADDDPRDWMHLPFNLTKEQFNSDLEDGDDMVLRAKWCRQWVGPGDWSGGFLEFVFCLRKFRHAFGSLRFLRGG